MTQQLQEAKEKVAKQTEVSSGKKPEHEKTRGKLLAAREEYKVALEKFAEIQKLARYWAIFLARRMLEFQREACCQRCCRRCGTGSGASEAGSRSKGQGRWAKKTRRRRATQDFTISAAAAAATTTTANVGKSTCHDFWNLSNDEQVPCSVPIHCEKRGRTVVRARRHHPRLRRARRWAWMESWTNQR